MLLYIIYSVKNSFIKNLGHFSLYRSINAGEKIMNKNMLSFYYFCLYSDIIHTNDNKEAAKQDFALKKSFK